MTCQSNICMLARILPTESLFTALLMLFVKQEPSPPNQQPYLHYQSLQCLFIALVSYRTDVWGQKDIAEDSWMLQYRQVCHASRSVKVKADISELKLLTKRMTAEKKFKCLSFYSFLFFFFFVIVCLVAVLSSKLLCSSLSGEESGIKEMLDNAYAL